MKYKNRLIVPTLISTALFGTALNAEAEEMSKEATKTHIEMEAQDTEESQEEQSPYIDPKDVEPAESTIKDEAPSVEEESVEVPIEEESEVTFEEPTVQKTADTTERETHETTGEKTLTEVTDTTPGESKETPPPEEEPVSEEASIEEKTQIGSEGATAHTGQQEESPDESPVTEDSEESIEDATTVKDDEETTKNTEDAELTAEETLEESAKEMDGDSDALASKEDVSEEQEEEILTEKAELEETPQENESAGNQVDQTESSNETSDDNQDGEAEETVENDASEESVPEGEEIDEESTEADAELENSGEEPLSKEAEALKEDADLIVMDKAMEEELLTMLKTYDIEMDESKSFFASTASAQPMTLAQAVTNINDYIKQNNFQAPRITYNHIAGLPKYNYRNGIGKPEGVVLHETANSSSTIHGEINWMSRNYNNAFVHAFVDKDNIIQVADTDHLAWGAGPNANPRFMHVELVRHDNKHDFAKSINNYTDYIANLLYKYKLPVDSAEADAKGTLWSHSAVSTHLGGTNHVDPYTYFSKFGYTYRDVEKLIEEKYMDLYNKKTTPKVNMPVTTSDAKYVGRIQASNKGLYASVTDVKTSSATKHLNKTFYVTRKATYNYDNYYLVQSDLEQAYVGWVHENDLRRLERTDSENYKQSFTVKDLRSYIFDVPWGTSKQVERLSNYKSSTFNTSKKMRIDNTDYIYGSFDGISGWVKLSDMEPLKSIDTSTPPVYKDDLHAARINDDGEIVFFESLSEMKPVSATPLKNRTVFVDQKAEYSGHVFYRVRQGYDAKPQGWVRAEDLRLFNLSEAKSTRKNFTVALENHYLLTDPWGTGKQQLKRLGDYHSPFFASERSLRLGSHIYYYGKINNTYGWVGSTKLDAMEGTPAYEETTHAARLNGGQHTGVYTSLTDFNQQKATPLVDHTIFVDQKAEYDGHVFYRVHQGYDAKPQGWVRAEDLRLFNLSEAKSTRKNFTVELENHYLLTDPWGTGKQQLKRLGDYHSPFFASERSLRLGSHIYYYGKINNTYGWVGSTKLDAMEGTPAYEETTHAARLNGGQHTGVYTSLTDFNQQKATPLVDRTIFVDQKAEYDGHVFYRVRQGYDAKPQGWVRAEDLRLFNLSEAKSTRKNFTVELENHYLLTDPWGTGKQQLKRLGDYHSPFFASERSLRLGSHIYYYGKIDNVYGWIGSTKIKPYEPSSPSPVVNTVKYGISLDKAVDIQMNLGAKPQAWVSGGGWRNATRSEVEQYLNPANHTTETWDYTYLDLNRAQNISSSELNNKLLNGKGILHNQGTAFLQAANTHGVNEVYLISHALHETGNGQSTLAQGVRLDTNGNISENGKLYYNMYGIAAYDHNPVLEGARYAQRMGWDTPAKAVIGGAQFISSGYFNRGQNTLYAMRWNPANPGTYQYATDVNWAYATARNLQNYYDQLGLQGQYYTRYTF